MNNAAMLEKCRRFADQVIPELQGTTYYILDSDALNNESAYTHDELVGWAAQAANVSELLPRYLGADWRGPGPAIFLNLTWLRRHAYPGQFERAVLGVEVHELGHLAFPLRMPGERTPRVASAIAELQDAVVRYSLNPVNLAKPANDEGHDWKWIRRTCHLYVRAAFRGYSLPHLRLLHSGYCDFASQDYLPQLLEEALRMREEPMEAIDALPPLQWLVEQYEADVERLMAEIDDEHPCGVV
ncbi:hypothetical protein [Lacipirellula sp.]|uniref:hypothetical protein n=1 Tax=Lacipirellula sp. TaxID=2691419 RepID=UPI003D0A8093